jgi:hypothetical protein
MSRFEFTTTAGLLAALNERLDWQDTVADCAAFTEDVPQAPAIRHIHGDRDAEFGVGYGNSSGYAADRHYVSNWATRMFRFT